MKSKSWFSGFTPPELAKLFILAIASGLAMVVSWANFESNLMATGESVFLEAPIKADLLACLAPSSSLIFASLCGFLTGKRKQYRFKLCLGGLTAVSLLAWLMASAIVLDGIATSDEAEAASDAAAKFYFYIQTQSEILGASLLHIALFDLLEEKFPKAQFLNPFYCVQSTKINELQAEIATAEDRHKNAVAEASHHRASRAAWINEQEQSFVLELVKYEQFLNLKGEYQ